jgi:ubiquinone/menaquinone biosynthesis C-methylase UbiE
MSAERPRVDSAEYWEDAAGGWSRRAQQLRDYTVPLSRWLVEAIDPQPGQRVLELAAGIGETGMLAAPLVLPGGTIICSDHAEAMLAAARARAAELGIENIEFRQLDAEWIDLPVASVDAVLCRWGYMLATEPAVALRETRRVLRPGGRLALAVWDVIERNPWAQVTDAVLREQGLLAASAPGAPGRFALADRELLRALLEDAGFQEIALDAIELEEVHPDFESFWATRLDLSRPFRDAVRSQGEERIADIRRELAAKLSPYTAADGRLKVPARTLVAAASA